MAVAALPKVRKKCCVVPYVILLTGFGKQQRRYRDSGQTLPEKT